MDAAPSVESVKVISKIHRARITHSAGLTQVSLRGEGVLVETPSERVAVILDSIAALCGCFRGSGAWTYQHAFGRFGRYTSSTVIR